MDKVLMSAKRITIVRAGCYWTAVVSLLQNAGVLLLSFLAWPSILLLPLTLYGLWRIERSVAVRVVVVDRHLLVYSLLDTIRDTPRTMSLEQQLISALLARADNRDVFGVTRSYKWTRCLSASCARAILSAVANEDL